jgi:hypothetical protein
MAYHKCLDRMCGAEDCPRCRPENFIGGIFVDDIEEDEETDEESEETEQREP